MDSTHVSQHLVHELSGPRGLECIPAEPTSLSDKHAVGEIYSAELLIIPSCGEASGAYSKLEVSFEARVIKFWQVRTTRPAAV